MLRQFVIDAIENRMRIMKKKILLNGSEKIDRRSQGYSEKAFWNYLAFRQKEYLSQNYEKFTMFTNASYEMQTLSFFGKLFHDLLDTPLLHTITTISMSGLPLATSAALYSVGVFTPHTSLKYSFWMLGSLISVCTSVNAQSNPNPFPPVFNLTTISSADGIILQGRGTGEETGISVSNVGDVNGDGRPDFLVGAFQAAPLSRNLAGVAYLVFGNDTWSAALDFNAFSSSNGVILQGAAVGDSTGYSASAAGDVNGDGMPDFLVGAPGADPLSRSNAGVAYLVFGRTVWPTTLDFRVLNGTHGVVLQGRASNDQTGSSLSAVGDVNGDGRADFLVGANQASPLSRSNAGAAYLIFGRAAWPAVLDFNTISSTDGVILQGRAANDVTGSSVSAAGDVNSDGRADFLVGASHSSFSSRSQAGITYLVFGRAAWPATLDLNTFSNTDGVVLQGMAAGDLTGVSVSAVGDVNGDMRADFLVGAYLASPLGRNAAGAAYLVFGRTAWPATLDFNIFGSTDGVVLQGKAAGDQTGISVSSAGDVNGDGRADFLVGANQASPFGKSQAGSAYLLFGRPVWPTALDFYSFSSTDGVILQGQAAGDQTGISISAAGDMNGDGRADFLIGACHASPLSRSDAGSAFLLFGRNSTTVNNVPLPDPTPTPPSSSGNDLPLSPTIIGAAGGGVALLLVCIVFLCCRYHRKQQVQSPLPTGRSKLQETKSNNHVIVDVEAPHSIQSASLQKRSSYAMTPPQKIPSASMRNHAASKSVVELAPLAQSFSQNGQPATTPSKPASYSQAPQSPGLKATLQISLNIGYNELEFGKVIGEGGFGVVYEGTYRHDKVAIKKLYLRNSSADILNEFQHEINVMANLRSRQIVQLLGASTEQQSYCIVMEHMAGGSLYNTLHNKIQPAFDWPQRIEWAIDIAVGLNYLHAENILHRDLKSMNVLLDENMKAKLSDFGLAKLKRESQSSHAGVGDAAGTLAWMAPELFNRGGKCTEKSDMYSYGMILWELTSGKIPFEDAPNPSVIPTWVQQGERERIPSDTPKEMQDLITQCWDKDPIKRPGTGDAITILRLLQKSMPAKQKRSSSIDPLISMPAYRGNFASERIDNSGKSVSLANPNSLFNSGVASIKENISQAAGNRRSQEFKLDEEAVLKDKVNARKVSGL